MNSYNSRKKDAIHVLHCTTHLNAGGVQSFLLNYNMNVFSENVVFDYLLQTDEKSKNENIVLNKGGTIFRVKPIKKGALKYIKSVYRILKDNPHIKIVHAHLNFQNILPLFAAKLAKVKVRISHSHSNYPTKSVFKRFLRFIFKIFIKNIATDYWACGEEAAKWLYGKSIISNNNMKIINNAIDVNKYKFDIDVCNKIRQKFDLMNKKVFIHVGMFSEVKNHDFLIELFSKILENNKDSVLILCGDGPKLSEIKSKVKNCNIDNSVIFMGLVSNVNEFLMAADVMLYPSLFEGLPLACVEAQVSGCACVLSKNIPNEVIFCENVYKCKTYDLNEWLNAINIVLSNNNNRYDSFKLCISAHYDIKTEANLLEKIYIQRGSYK